MRVESLRFDHWQEFLDASFKEHADMGHSRANGLPESNGQVWNGTQTWDEAVELATHGWQEPFNEVSLATQQIKDDLRPRMINTFDSFFDVSGAQVDMDRFLSGEPENMVQLVPIKVAKPGRVISLLVNVGYTAVVTPKQIMQRGIAICGLIECLELLQHSCEIWLESSASHVIGGDSSRFSVIVKMKAADEKLDVGRMMFGIANPATLRRLVFSLREQTPNNQSEYGGKSMGQSRRCIRQDEVKPTLVLDLLEDERTHYVDPEAWIRDNLSEFGLFE